MILAIASGWTDGVGYIQVVVRLCCLELCIAGRRIVEQINQPERAFPGEDNRIRYESLCCVHEQVPR